MHAHGLSLCIGKTTATHPFPFRVATGGSSFVSQGMVHDKQLPCIVNLITICMYKYL